MEQPTPSIREIAHRLKVHPSSVSRALTGKAGVSSETRKRVLAAAEDLGYVPDLHARQLRLGGKAGLAVIVEQHPTDITSVRNYELFHLGNAAFGSVHVLVRPPDMPYEAVLRSALEASVAAVLVSGLQIGIDSSTAAMLRRRRVALVTVDGRVPGVDAVWIRREVGTRQVGRYFQQAGFLRPLVLSAVPVSQPDARLSGILSCYEPGGGVRSPTVRVLQGHEYEDGYRLATDVRSGGHDAVFCYNDRIATGLLKGLAELDVRVPADCSVIGFDDVPFARYLSSSLSTVAQPTLACAEAAIDAVSKRIAQPELPATTIEFPTRLVLRETTRSVDDMQRASVFEEYAT